MFRRERVATRASTGWARDEVRGASRGWPSGDTAFRTRPRAMSGKGAVINWGRIVQKRAKKGLFAGKTTHFGNRVSEDGEQEPPDVEAQRAPKAAVQRDAGRDDPAQRHHQRAALDR